MNIRKISAIILNTFCISIRNPKKVRIFATAFSIEVERLIRKARQGIQTLILNAFSFFIQKFYICELERKLFFQIVEMRSRYPDSQQGAFFCLKSDPLPAKARENSRANLLKSIKLIVIKLKMINFAKTLNHERTDFCIWKTCRG